jgi:hypothetical protein
MPATLGGQPALACAVANRINNTCTYVHNYMPEGFAMQIVASVATYAELRDALRERRLALGLAQLTLDHCAGLQDA